MDEPTEQMSGPPGGRPGRLSAAGGPSTAQRPTDDGIHAGDRGRLKEILSASRDVYGQPTLRQALSAVAERACGSTGARYGAVSIVQPDGSVEEYGRAGRREDWMTPMAWPGPGTTAAPAPPPAELSGPSIRSGPAERGSSQPERIGEYLAIPVSIRDERYGTLHLTDTAHGGGFTDSDRQFVAILADMAAVVVENSRLAVEGRTRQNWLEASTEITRKLLTPGEHNALADIAAQIKTLADADVVKVVLPTEDGSQLRIEVAVGEGELELPGRVYPMAGTLSQATITSGEPIRLVNAEDVASLEVHFSDGVRVGPVIALAMIAAGRPRGALIAGRLTGRATFTLAELDMAATFAGHAAIALELADSRAAQDRVTLLEERNRIARDLHDHVIQRLFAAGLTLQSALTVTSLEEKATRISRVVDEIDLTIRQVRTSIFGLHDVLHGQETARGAIMRTIDSVAPTMHRPPRVIFGGPLDTMVSADLLGDILAVLRESLTNVVRHARADTVQVNVGIRGGQFTLEVIDDGVGLGGSTRRSGLENLHRRAAELAGQLTVIPCATGGTELRWTVPLN